MLPCKGDEKAFTVVLKDWSCHGSSRCRRNEDSSTMPTGVWSVRGTNTPVGAVLDLLQYSANPPQSATQRLSDNVAKVPTKAAIRQRLADAPGPTNKCQARKHQTPPLRRSCYCLSRVDNVACISLFRPTLSPRPATSSPRTTFARSQRT